MNEHLKQILALVSSEDWPALEQMGQETTAVSTKALLDLSDICEAALIEHESHRGS